MKAIKDGVSPTRYVQISLIDILCDVDIKCECKKDNN